MKLKTKSKDAINRVSTDGKKLPEGWEWKKLGEVCEYDKKQGSYNKPYVGLEDIESNTGKFVGSFNNRIVKSTTFEFNHSHILYGRLRPYLNKVLVPNFEGHCSTEIFTIKASNEVDRDFLATWFMLDSTVYKINSTCTGARMPRANMKEILTFYIPLPPLSEQKRIVAILDEAFTAIDKAKANAEKNLANAKELFDSYLSSVSTDKKPLGNFVDITTGKLDANAAVENGQYPFFTCSRNIYAINTYAFDCEAILLAGNNAVGDFNVKHYKGKFNAYQRTYVITINENNGLLYRFLYFQMFKSLKEFKENSVGAGTRFLKIGMIKNLQISVPPLTDQRHIVEKLDTLLSELQKLESICQQKIVTFEELKKSILKKAFEGEL